MQSSAKLQRLVSEGFHQRPWHQQLYLSSVFTADHSLHAASCLRGHLLAALDVDDYDKVVSLAQNLAMQFCTADVELLDQIYHHNLADPELAQVAETLYVLNTLSLLNDPRSRIWKRAHATVEELHMAQKLKADTKHSANAPDSVHAPAEINHPGRNAPCPCGSGKKMEEVLLVKLIDQTHNWHADLMGQQTVGVDRRGNCVDLRAGGTAVGDQCD